jgi:hypothetical protein
MPPYYGMPYGAAPAYSFSLAEVSVYILFIICLIHAIDHQRRHLTYMIGGVIFGLLLEFVDVYFLNGYTYGRFQVMIGKAPLDIPLWIGVGWGVILYSSRLFTDRLGLPIAAAAAFDALLALNIDGTMDVTAYRLHMWDWGWSATHQNPLTSQWFGIPWNNYLGWMVVIFTYSGFSRRFARWKIKILVPVAAIVFSEIILFLLFNNVIPWLNEHGGIRSLHLFVGLFLILGALVFSGWKKRKMTRPVVVTRSIPAWLVPAWFHLYFTLWFFLAGFNHENNWMTTFALANLLLGCLIHIIPTGAA